MSEYNKDKHLEFVLGAIDRQARTSFVLKGWSVTLVAAIFLLAARGAEPESILPIALLPSIVFWGLDAFYLCQERRFRALFDDVRRETLEEDFYSMEAWRYKDAVPSWRQTLFAPTVLWIHAINVVVVLSALLLFELKQAFQ